MAYASLGIDNSLSLIKFSKGFSINVLNLTDNEMQFEMKGVDAPIANAFRRILLSEVPTMAIDQINLYQNTSIVQDEVLL